MGESLSGCVEDFERNLNQLTSTERADVEKAVEGCLGLSDCGNFLGCISQ